MNLFTGKNFKSDDCIFNVHSFATELDEDTLRTKVNGGCCDASAPPAPPAGNNTPKAPAITETSPTTTPGTSPTTNTPNPSDPSNPGSGYTGGGYEPPPEVMSNPQAYGYWKALQALAEQQGDPDRYKDYNVDGTKFVSSTKTKNTYSSDDRLQRQIDSLTKKRADLNKNDSIYGAPTDSRRVTSPKGVRTDANPTNHTGIDIGAKIPGTKGDNIYSVENGNAITEIPSEDVPGCLKEDYINEIQGYLQNYTAKHPEVAEIRFLAWLMYSADGSVPSSVSGVGSAI